MTALKCLTLVLVLCTVVSLFRGADGAGSRSGDSKSRSASRDSDHSGGSSSRSGSRSESGSGSRSRSGSGSRSRSGSGNRSGSGSRRSRGGDSSVRIGKKPGVMKRLKSKAAITVGLSGLADVETLKASILKEAERYAEKAAKARHEKDLLLEKFNYDDDFPYAEENWAINVVKVALAYHKVLDIIYGGVKKSKGKHAGEAARHRYREDYKGVQKVEFHEHMKEQAANALGLIKGHTNLVEKAKAHQMDVLTMFYKLMSIGNNYYRKHFKVNVVALLPELEKRALKMVANACVKYGGRGKARKVQDPDVTGYVKHARIGGSEESSSRGSKSSHSRSEGSGSRTGGSSSRTGGSGSRTGGSGSRTE